VILSHKSAVEAVVIRGRFHPEQKITIKVGKETILAAGAVHTPQILQLSGIGPKNILKAAGIKLNIDLPGVGQNLQDHAQAMFTCNCKSTSTSFSGFGSCSV
jgi:choline dehydrogenase-like flavoprotein